MVCWEGFAVRFTPRSDEQIVRCSGLTEDNPATGSQWQPAGGEASETDLPWQCSFRQISSLKCGSGSEFPTAVPCCCMRPDFGR